MLSCNVCNLMAARLHQLQVVSARHAPQSHKQNDRRQCHNNGSWHWCPLVLRREPNAVQDGEGAGSDT